MRSFVKLLIVTVLTMANFGFGFAQASQPTVVIDGWWRSDYAKNGCEQATSWMNENQSLINREGCDAVTACTDVMPKYVACTTSGVGAAGEARNCETDLITQFATKQNCKGASFARVYSSSNHVAAMDVPHWALIIDYVVGSPIQDWTLVPDPKSNLNSNLQGQSPTAANMADSVCAIVLGEGGQLSH
jgi:hypothetical protein